MSGNNFGLNDNLKYYEFEIDSLDNSGSFKSGSAATDWPVFLLGGKAPLSNIAAVKIIEAQIPFSWYVFNSGNNSFYLYEQGNYVTFAVVTLPIGNFTTGQMVTNLKTALDAATMNALTYTVTYNPSTLKFTFTNTGTQPFAFSFGADDNSGNINPRLYIGFPGGYTYSTAQTMVAPNVALVSGPNYVYVNSQKIGQLCNMYLPQGAFNLGGGNAGPQMAKIPVNVQSGGIIYWQEPDPQKWFDFENLTQLNQVDFYLTLGNTTTQTPLRLNGLGFSLKLGVLVNIMDKSSSYGGGSLDRVVKRIKLI
jgi:hypothetical protein